MAANNLQKLRLYQDVFSEDRMTHENSLAKALLTQPDVISPVLTHLVGKEDKRFPLSFVTEGLGNIHYVEDTQYEYPVIGRLRKALKCTQHTGTGANHSIVKLSFSENLFIKSYIIEASNGVKFRLQSDPVRTPDGYTFDAVVVSTSAAGLGAVDYEGLYFVQLFAPQAMAGSRGNESRFVVPSKMTNQINLIRKSYGYEGNVQNRTVNIELPTPGGGTSTYWVDFEEYQHMLN